MRVGAAAHPAARPRHRGTIVLAHAGFRRRVVIAVRVGERIVRTLQGALELAAAVPHLPSGSAADVPGRIGCVSVCEPMVTIAGSRRRSCCQSRQVEFLSFRRARSETGRRFAHALPQPACARRCRASSSRRRTRPGRRMPFPRKLAARIRRSVARAGGASRGSEPLARSTRPGDKRWPEWRAGAEAGRQLRHCCAGRRRR